MKIADSNLADQIKDVHITDQGVFYFLEGIVISELNEGITYTWEDAESVIQVVRDFYGSDPNVCYISNRVNKYSVKPSDWLNFYRNNHELNGYAVVTQNENSWYNALMEKLFSKVEIKRFNNIYEAIDWCKSQNKNKQENSIAS